MYTENPKTKGSGIMCCIPQKGTCPIGCEDCFFQSGRSYLEPLQEKTPNMPDPEKARGMVVRVNDGNDSSNHMREVIAATSCYEDKFYNTSIVHSVSLFDGPVVLTVNPAGETDLDFLKLSHIPKNLMFVRVRTNTWNIKQVVDPAVMFYTSKKVPVVLTFMAYFTGKVKQGYEKDYAWRKRTENYYAAITNDAWKRVMNLYRDNPYVYSCGKIEGTDTSCARCGNCIREYYVTKTRMQNSE